MLPRSSSDTNLSAEVLRQITSFPKTLVVVAATLGVLLLLPGIPWIPSLVLIGAVLLAAWLAQRAKQAQAEPAPAGAVPEGVTAEPAAAEQDDPYALLPVEPIEVSLGSHWTALVNAPGAALMERIAVFRKQHAQEFGIVLPRVVFKAAPKLGPDRYEIVLDGTPRAKGEVFAERLLAIHPSGDVRSIPGTLTRDPTYGLPALWIDASQRAAAAAAKYTLVDGPTVFVTHLSEVLRRESATLLSRAETDKLLARVRTVQPGLVEELIPAVLSVSDIQKVLQNLLREKVSIRHLEAILETLADAGRQTKDAALLTEHVRHRLGHAICQGLLGDSESLQVLTLDPAIEAQFLQSLKAARDGDGAAQPFVLDPKLTEQLVTRLAQQAERMMKSNLLPVLLCAPELRRHVRTLSERLMPHLRVLSMAEIPQSIQLKAWGVVSA